MLSVDRDLVKDALAETIRRYPGSEAALTFFYFAAGLSIVPPTDEDILWAKDWLSGHASDCAVHSMPAYPAGPCNCRPIIGD